MESKLKDAGRPRAGGQLCLCMEGLPVSEDSVEDRQEFSGDGDQSELWRFSGCGQDFIERLEARGVTNGDEGGDIERVAHTLSAATDGALATSCSAVIVEGRQSHQGGELLG